LSNYFDHLFEVCVLLLQSTCTCVCNFYRVNFKQLSGMSPEKRPKVLACPPSITPPRPALRLLPSHLDCASPAVTEQHDLSSEASSVVPERSFPPSSSAVLSTVPQQRSKSLRQTPTKSPASSECFSMTSHSSVTDAQSSNVRQSAYAANGMCYADTKLHTVFRLICASQLSSQMYNTYICFC